jgi:hypothetical protein
MSSPDGEFLPTETVPDRSRPKNGGIVALIAILAPSFGTRIEMWRIRRAHRDESSIFRGVGSGEGRSGRGADFDRGFGRGPDGRFDGDGFADTDPVVEASQRDETDEPPGTTAFIMLVERIQAILERNGDERDPFFVAAQLHTWIHGIVDLTCRHPAFEWPTIDELLDDLIVRLDLDSPNA